jgi:MFS family permease
VSYLIFVLKNARFLSFGILLTLFGNFGQTYYISLFSVPIREAYGLSHGDFGMLYSAATFTSAACLVWAGRKIDDTDLRLYVLIVCSLFAAACFLISSVTISIYMLALGVFLLRMTGQGLMGHTAMTSMARTFNKNRGKAMSVASVGHSLGSAFMPSVAVALLAAFGWRDTWQFIGWTIIIVLIPGALFLLRGDASRYRPQAKIEKSPQGDAKPSMKQWTRSEVLRDPRFYFIIPCALAAPLILTGLFFHQVHLADSKGWSLEWMASSFVGFALSSVIGSFITGILVDRYGSLSILPCYLLPLICGLIVLVFSSHPSAAMIYMVGAGLTTGASSITLTSTWAEIYGTAHIGAIRSVVSASMVFSTGLAPALMGWFIDLDVSIERIVIASLVYIALSIGLIVSVLPRLRNDTGVSSA